MASRKEAVQAAVPADSVAAQYTHIRSATVALCQHLEFEDYVVQSMSDVSPTKWHLAHVTWFFERFVLKEYSKTYDWFNEDFDYVLNSYFYTGGGMYARPDRGLLTRPTVNEVIAYREYVDNAMLDLIAEKTGDKDFDFLIEVGLNHEQQHQERILTDIKHVFSVNPVWPTVNPALMPAPVRESPPHEFRNGPSGIREIGHKDDSYCFDNEMPRHPELIAEHQIGSRLINNGEYLNFIRDAGYSNPKFWHSDGWAIINREGWIRPLYWAEGLDAEFTLGGKRELDLQAPVTHVSYYEAFAYAKWAGARLPTEAEWEWAARGALANNIYPWGNEHIEKGAKKANFWQGHFPVFDAAEDGFKGPSPVRSFPPNSYGLYDMAGNVWEWCSDWFHTTFHADGPRTNPQGPPAGEAKVMRGGSYLCHDSYCHRYRVSARSSNIADSSTGNLGFRVAAEPTDT